MKKLFIGILFLLPTLALASADEDLQNICTIVEANDVTELRKKDRIMRSDYNLQLRDYFEGVRCNGLDMLMYSFNAGSEDTLNYILKRLPKKYLIDNADKYPVEVRSLINERIGG